MTTGPYGGPVMFTDYLQIWQQTRQKARKQGK